MSRLDHPAVARVREALRAAGSAAEVVELSATARTAADAAQAVGAPVGAIVKSLVFLIGDRPVMALVSGDRRCRAQVLPAVLGQEGPVRRANADAVREATGFVIGGVAPLGHPAPLPVAIDAGLEHFGTVWAAAGHPFCVFATSTQELVRITGGVISAGVAEDDGPQPGG